jgi:hypothetical protein
MCWLILMLCIEGIEILHLIEQDKRKGMMMMGWGWTLVSGEQWKR